MPEPRHPLRAWPRADVLLRPGTKLLKPFVDSPHALTNSGFEDDFLAFVEKYGLPRPEISFPFNGRRLDANWPQFGVIAECDGWQTHRSREAFEDDRERDADHVDHGLITVRVTKTRLEEAAGYEAARFKANLQAAGWLVGVVGGVAVVAVAPGRRSAEPSVAALVARPAGAAVSAVAARAAVSAVPLIAAGATGAAAVSAVPAGPAVSAVPLIAAGATGAAAVSAVAAGPTVPALVAGPTVPAVAAVSLIAARATGAAAAVAVALVAVMRFAIVPLPMVTLGCVVVPGAHRAVPIPLAVVPCLVGVVAARLALLDGRRSAGDQRGS